MNLVTPYQVDRGLGRYCNRACLTRSQTKRVERTCEYCAATFIAKASRVDRGNARFCSVLCVRGKDRDAAALPDGHGWSDVDLAYLAGVIDGEGSFGIVKRTEGSVASYRLRLYITNSSQELMSWVKDRFGGRVHSRTKPSGTIVHQWVSTDLAVESVTRAVAPYLLVKRRHAEVALRFRASYRACRGGDTRSGSTVPQDQLAHREACWREMSILTLAGGKSRKGPRRGLLLEMLRPE